MSPNYALTWGGLEAYRREVTLTDFVFGVNGKNVYYDILLIEKPHL